MKRKMLLMMMCAPVILSAQNGVTVSGLTVNAGISNSPTTVTFNVSWETPMPVEPWSDSVWVFVDYNNAGKMERLPLLPGTMLTNSSWDGAYVDEIADNDQGVWVVGNARSAGSFSVTVQLLTATANLAGVCAYASNYPPVGEYISGTQISFTGTPMYEIVVKPTDGGSTFSDYSDGLYTIRATGDTIQSFTDATGAPGIMKCIPMTGDIDFTVPAVSKNQQVSFEVSSTIDTPPDLITYGWSAPGFSPATYEGTTFTSTAPATRGAYSVTLTAYAVGYCGRRVKTKEVEVTDCTAPGATVNFTAFSPCSNATAGDYWHLTDTRESTNVQTYKVKKIADGNIWMVQGLKFGDKCTTKTTFTGSKDKDMTGVVTSLTDKTYYGDCSAATTSSTPANRGYYYDWAASLNKSGAYYGSSVDVGCSGTGSSANACQGICPNGWHVPTSAEYEALIVAVSQANMLSSSHWEGVYGGNFRPGASGPTHQGIAAMYRVSTYYNANLPYNVWGENNKWIIYIYNNSDWSKNTGQILRCLRNY